jgi:hypothetical protein
MYSVSEKREQCLARNCRPDQNLKSSHFVEKKDAVYFVAYTKRILRRGLFAVILQGSHNRKCCCLKDQQVSYWLVVHRTAIIRPEMRSNHVISIQIMRLPTNPCYFTHILIYEYLQLFLSDPVFDVSISPRGLRRDMRSRAPPNDKLMASLV